MNLTDMLAQHIDEGGGAFCSCQPIDDETGEREHLPGSWEQHLADQIREWLLSDQTIQRAKQGISTADQMAFNSGHDIDYTEAAHAALTAALDQGDQ